MTHANSQTPVQPVPVPQIDHIETLAIKHLFNELNLYITPVSYRGHEMLPVQSVPDSL